MSLFIAVRVRLVINCRTVENVNAEYLPRIDSHQQRRLSRQEAADRADVTRAFKRDSASRVSRCSCNQLP